MPPPGQMKVGPLVCAQFLSLGNLFDELQEEGVVSAGLKHEGAECLYDEPGWA